MIDFTLSESQNAIRTNAAAFAHDFLRDAAKAYTQHPTQKDRFQALRPFYSQAVKCGLVRGLIPSRLGGTASAVLDAALMVEEMYKVDRNLSLTVFANSLGLGPVVAAGSAEQQERFLRPFVTGEGEPLASLLHSEPQGTANYLETGGRGLQTLARRDGRDWVLDGEKVWATNSCGWDDRGADLMSVVCRYAQDGGDQDPDSDPAQAVMIFVITRDTVAKNDQEAFQVLRHTETAGHSSTGGPHIKFTRFRVPDENIVAPPGEASAIVTRGSMSSAALVGAMSVGIMAATFEAALKFARSDARGGAQSLLSRQSVADKLMDIKMRTDAARFITWKACHALDNGQGPELALETKVFCSEMAVKCVVDAMSAVGISSYDKGSVFPELLNDAMLLPLSSGGNVGIRRRQLEKLLAADDYQPWRATYGDSRSS